jgi:uncharacterized protein (TIGR02145 family)
MIKQRLTLLAVIGLCFFAYKTFESSKTVKMPDGKAWMKENLNIEAGKSACYNNNPDNCKKYGRLYDWETAIKACPKGLHLPTNSEWEALERAASSFNRPAKTLWQKEWENSEKATDGSITASALKSRNGWFNEDGMDKYGFTALPGGRGLSGGYSDYFDNAGYYGYWWTATENNADYAYYRIITYSNEFIYKNYSDKTLLLSVRCVRD